MMMSRLFCLSSSGQKLHHTHWKGPQFGFVILGEEIVKIVLEIVGEK